MTLTEHPPSTSTATTTELSRRLIDTTSSRPTTPFGLYVIASAAPEAELARDLERQVFFEYFGNTPERLAEEYAAYEPSSLFFCVLDHERSQPAGMLRLITPSPAGFKSLDDLAKVWETPADEALARTGLNVDLTRTWDIATIAVAPDYRGNATRGLVSLALYQALGILALPNGIEWFVTVLDLVVLDLIQTRLQRPWTPIPGIEPANYLDSPASLPAITDLVDYRDRLELVDQPLFELIFEGQGLESVIALPHGYRTSDQVAAAG